MAPKHHGGENYSAGRYLNKNVHVLRLNKPAGVIHIVATVLTTENEMVTAPESVTRGRVEIGLEKEVAIVAQRIRISPGNKAAGVTAATADPGTDDHADEDHRVVDRVPTDVAQTRSVRATQMSVTQRMWMSITVNNRVLASNRDHIQINLTGEVTNLNLNHPRKFNLHLHKLNQSRPK